jgi:hypothetical protein
MMKSDSCYTIAYEASNTQKIDEVAEKSPQQQLKVT